MKFIIALILTAILSYISGIYFPWWGIAFVAFIVAILIPQRPGKAFLSGFSGVFLLWLALAWWIDRNNNGILAMRMAELLPLGGSRLLLILVTGLVGGLVAGFSALSGSFLRNSGK
ncbi:MAG: hypothetical protein IPQ08_03675 [Chitinophagaceae bacterium]|nr:hypothetical protein [Chitinophagaceae bacterium]